VCVHVFWIKCGYSGVGECVLGVGVGLLDKVRLFMIGCRCSRLVVGVLEWERVF